MIIELLEQWLTGNPVEDAIIIGIIFTIFWELYRAIFGATFSIFKK